MKNMTIVCMFVGLIFVVSCTTKRIDRYGREEAYGYVTLRETTIYETSEGVKQIGTLPKYFSFKIAKENVRADNGLICVYYDSGAPFAEGEEFPRGWINLNDIKLLAVWEYPTIDITTQEEVSQHKYPMIAAQARQVISDFDKEAAAWPKDMREAIKKGEIMLEMTTDMVLLSVGLPTKVNKNKGPDVIEEQWIYSRAGQKTNYIYFKNGKVVNSQIVGENVKETE